MRFMMMVKLSSDYADRTPEPEDYARMTAYNEELTKAGVLLALDGLAPLAEGARISWSGGRGRVLDGPYTEVKELIGGYWIIQVSSKEEALEWAKRAPMDDGDVMEVRRIPDLADFPAEVQGHIRLSQDPPQQTG